jgi:linoleoyl-CoA desaturase
MQRLHPFDSEAGRSERALHERAAASASDARDTLKFAGDKAFHLEVKRRVFDYFERTGLSPRDSPRMYTKTAVLLLWFGGSYAWLVFATTTFWQGSLLSLSLALALAGIGFGVQHDANHGAYSNHGAVNRLLGMTLDLLGASSYLWHFKHNIAHHTYTNVAGADDDIDIGPLARLSPAQPRRRFHRVQHFYLWALYGLLIPKWHFIYDFKNVARARIARNRFPRPRGFSLVQLIGGKAMFFGWAMVVPILFHPWWVVLLYYAGISMVLGLVLGVVFQLAHCVEEADFPEPPPGTLRLPHAWAVHQVRTTVDFARGNRMLSWYLGGLNFQIEHHLFPRICHVHYPRIAHIVQAACAEFGVRYTAHESFLGAVSSHWRWLRRMGRPLLTTSRARSAATNAVVTSEACSACAPESVELLDGGEQAYPRMLLAIAGAQRSVDMEVYAFARSGVGASFVDALTLAASRGVAVRVLIDGWGSARGGRAVAAALRDAGCTVRIYHRLLALLLGRFGRNHRKVLLVDDEVAFLGGINIGDENVGEGVRLGWADLALEIRGPQCARLGQMIRREPRRSVDSSLRIYVCGLGGGWRLRRQYIKAFASARERIDVAHGYFLPDLGIVRAITAAARRGVQVRLLLAGRSDIPFARTATRSLYRRLLAVGVCIHEWTGSVLHAKVATIDGRRLLVGSFNLDPFSLANQEALVEVADARVVKQGEAWIQDHFARSRSMTSAEASLRLQRWLLDPLGRLIAWLTDTMVRVIARRKRGSSSDRSSSSRTRHPGLADAEERYRP